jgi:hypothetical protein
MQPTADPSVWHSIGKKGWTFVFFDEETKIYREVHIVYRYATDELSARG